MIDYLSKTSRGLPILRPPPTRRWQYAMAQWMITQLLVFWALCYTSTVWANDPPIFVSGSAEPSTIDVGQTIRFESIWRDPEDNFVIAVRVEYCHQGTSICTTEFLDYIEGTVNPRVGMAIEIPITEAGVYDYQFFAVDAEPKENPLHRDEELDWYDGGSFTVVESTGSTPVVTPDPDKTPDDTVTPPPIDETPDDTVNPPPIDETPDDTVTPLPDRGTTDCTQVTQISQAECETLVALYNSTNGPNWFDSPENDWNKTNEPCIWWGVSCDCDWENWENGCWVREIYLSNNNLIGSIPDLSHLTKLEKLDLGDNQLTGPIPNLSYLTNLEKLYLEWNQLTGSIPDLSHLTRLKSLILENNQLTGPIPDLSHLTKLEKLDLGSNQLTGPIPNLSYLINLEELDLGWNQLTGTIPDLSYLTNLAELHLEWNQLTGPIPDLSHLTHLSYLWLSGNHFSGEIPFSLSTLNNLFHLTLEANCLTASKPELIAFLNEKAPYWQNQWTGCLSGNYTVSGTVSLPNGDIAPTGGIEIPFELWVQTSEYWDLTHGGYIRYIPENQSSVSFSLLIPEDSNTEWMLGINCNDSEWNEELGQSVSNGNCDKYVRSLQYSTSGMTTAWGTDNTIFQGGRNYPNTNLVLLPGVPISGTVSLPPGKVAPEGGIELGIDANESENGENGYNFITIPAGESTASYRFNVIDNAQVEWAVRYYCYSCPEEIYQPEGYYNSTGTTVDKTSATLLPGGQSHSNINLTLIPFDDTQAPTVSISSPPSTVKSADHTSLSGTASPNTVKVTWQNDQGGEGEATMTINDEGIVWTLDNIPLKVGENMITITAYNEMGLQSSETITITVPEPDFKISAVYPDFGIYNRKERPLTVWWETTDTSYNTEVLIVLRPFPDNGIEISGRTQNDEQETFIIPDDIEAGDWSICISSVLMTNIKCASGYITIE